MPGSSIRVVCFDVGGVMIRICYRWIDAARGAGIPFPADQDPEAALHAFPEFEEYQAGLCDEDRYFEGLSRFFGGVSREKAVELHNRVMIEPYPGVDQLVADLQAAGILTACLSNTNDPHWRAMVESGRFPANERLDLRMASHEVQLQKPSREIFDLFAAKAGAMPTEILLFDDLGPNVEAARAAGWEAVLVDPTGDPAAQMRRELEDRGLLGRP